MVTGERDGGMLEEFASWYQLEHPKVLAVLCATSGDPELAREATDEAFVRCFARWSRVREMASPAGWTYRVALNVLRRARRRQAMERRLLFRQASQTRREAGSAAGSEAGLEPVWSDIVHVLAVLSQRQRTAVVLRYVADLPEADIALAMKVRRGTVASTLADARRNLAPYLQAGRAVRAGPADRGRANNRGVEDAADA